MIDFTSPSPDLETNGDNLISIPFREWEGEVSLTNTEYHSGDGASSSDLKHMLKSPAHFKRLSIEKDQVEKEKTPALEFGDMAHDIFLMGTIKSYVPMPEFEPITGLTKKGTPKTIKTIKAQNEEFQKANELNNVVSHGTYEKLYGMHQVLKGSELVSGLMKGSTVERSFYYLDEPTGLKLKFRPDILNIEGGFIADYKTAISASPHEFRKAVARYHYHLSAAHYLAGVKRLFGVEIDRFIYIVQEKVEPYALGIYELSKSDVQKSYQLRRRILDDIAKHKAMNLWPDYSTEIRKLHVPAYGYEYKGEQ